MKQLVLKRYGLPFALEDTLPKEPGKNQIRIRTTYAGISYTDLIIQKGYYRYQRDNFKLPYVPGFEAGGIVLEVGREVGAVKVGDKVVVMQKSGCFAEEVIADCENVFLLEEKTDPASATSLPVNYFTAWHALNNIVNILPNSNILITSAAGGVGGLLVQLCSGKHNVTGLVGREEKLDYALALGVNKAFTYDNFVPDRKYDVILTATGNKTREYFNCLSANGKLIVYGFHSMMPRSKLDWFKSVWNYLTVPKFSLLELVYNNKTLSGFNIINLDQNPREYLATRNAFKTQLLSPDTLKRHQIKIFPVGKHQEAFDYLESGESVGKILLEF